MGAWGAGPFDNDDALDIVPELDSAEAIASELSLAGTEEVVEAPQASRIVVAAECVAAMRGYPHPELPDNLAERLAKLGPPSLELYNGAREGVSAVIAHSELSELWAENGSGEWNREMTRLVDRLNRPQVDATKPAPKRKAPQPNPSPCLFCDKPMGEAQFHMLDVTISEDEFSSSTRGGWVHLECLNAALHPKHMIQNWQFDDELLDFVRKKFRESD